MNSSARSRNDSGIVSPIALPLVTLMTNLVGCSNEQPSRHVTIHGLSEAVEGHRVSEARHFKGQVVFKVP